MKPVHRFLPVAVLAAALAGCAAIPTRAPVVSLAAIDIVEAGLLEQRFGLKLRLLNPNDVDIVITGLSFQLEVNGQGFARGVSDRAVTLPRFGEALLEVEALSNLGRLLRQLEELSRGPRDSIAYRIHGQLAAGSLGTLPFEANGEMQLPRLPVDRRPKSAPGGT